MNVAIHAKSSSQDNDRNPRRAEGRITSDFTISYLVWVACSTPVLSPTVVTSPELSDTKMRSSWKQWLNCLPTRCYSDLRLKGQNMRQLCTCGPYLNGHLTVFSDDGTPFLMPRGLPAAASSPSESRLHFLCGDRGEARGAPRDGVPRSLEEAGWFISALQFKISVLKSIF